MSEEKNSFEKDNLEEISLKWRRPDRVYCDPNRKQAIKEAIETYIEKQRCVFTGEYRVQIHGNKIPFPWKKKAPEAEFMWSIYQQLSTGERKMFVYTLAPEEDEKELKLLDRGTCTIDDEDRWLLPECIADSLKSNYYLWIGCMNFAEFMPDTARASEIYECIKRDMEDMLKELEGI